MRRWQTQSWSVKFCLCALEISISETKRCRLKAAKELQSLESDLESLCRYLELNGESFSARVGSFFGEGVFCSCEVPEMRDRESKMSIVPPYIYISIKSAVTTRLKANKAAWLSPVIIINSCRADLCQALHVRRRKTHIKRCKIMDILRRK